MENTSNIRDVSFGISLLICQSLSTMKHLELMRRMLEMFSVARYPSTNDADRYWLRRVEIILKQNLEKQI